MQRREIYAGLDLGATKTAVVVMEVDESGNPVVIGYGLCPSHGIKRGTVINIDSTIQSIEKAIEAAEIMGDVHISSVFAGIAGDHIRAIQSDGFIAVARSSKGDRRGVITQEDVKRVLEAAQTINLPMDREVLHVIPQQFRVDGEVNIQNPVGLMGVRLETDVHIITGAVANAQNIYRCVKKAGISVWDLVLESLASSYAVLTDSEKEMGVALIDLGSATTDIMVFKDKIIRHTSSLSMAGEMVTKELAHEIRLPFDQAEQLKIQYGHSFLPMLSGKEEIELPGIGSQRVRRVKREVVTEIIQNKMEEVFENVSAQLKGAGVYDELRSGAVLTGGMAQLPGVANLAEIVLGMPVKIGYPKGFGGTEDAVKSPVFATAVGLVLYGLKRGESLDPLRGDDSTIFTKIFGRMREWFDDFF
ncbi:cell division protein FtsA [bacterium]|nr:cell division protein FtsA [bacterium]